MADNNNTQHIVWHDDVIVKQFISYAVGCMMGRYSIDKPGLILANQGDGLKEYEALVPNFRFEIDDDGIIPLMPSNTDFADNATVRFKKWLAVVLGEERLVENLNTIEAALGKSIDDFFVKDFWKYHKKMYQNRPIYWLFSSKKGAFQCIAYMHRMTPYTAEQIRTKYLLPHIEWLVQKQNEMEENAANLSTSERRELDRLTKRIAECREYHDRLHEVADKQIAFDLDDGVVVNYAKFGGANGLFSNPTLTQIGEKYGKTAAQVALRWLLQNDVIIIPKTVHKQRMQENLSLFDFELDAEDMQVIATLDTGHSLFLDHHDGEVTKQFMEWRAVVKPTE